MNVDCKVPNLSPGNFTLDVRTRIAAGTELRTGKYEGEYTIRSLSWSPADQLFLVF